MGENIRPNTNEDEPSGTIEPSVPGKKREGVDETLIVPGGIEVPLEGDVTLHDTETGITEKSKGRDVGEGSSAAVTKDGKKLVVNKVIKGANITGGITGLVIKKDK